MKISRFKKAKRQKFAGVPVTPSRNESWRIQQQFNRMVAREIERIKNQNGL